MSNKIKELMEKNGMKQTELAEIAGVSQAFMSIIIRGYKTPSVAVLKRIADYFGVTVDYLLN